MDKRGIAVTAIVGGVAIFGIKLYSYYISGSVALLSDALESIVNIVASIMMYISIRISEQPPDDNHRYGHQKIENISSFIEGALIIVAGALIGRAAINRLLEPVTLVSVDLAIGISLFATALNGLLSWLLMKKAEETRSMALEGDAKHLFSDVVSSIGVAFGLFIGQYLGIPILDPLMAIIVAFMVLRLGIGLVYKSGCGLMDESCPEIEEKIRKLMDRHKSQFVDYHSLKTRRSGDRVFAELHLSLDGSLSVQEAHDFTDHLEWDVENEVPGVDLTIHVEPPRKKESE
ncbi:MAG TPA: cation diffusion facilitator family transporter [Candidatus Krumholzibacteriaceae bacterium]|nr:cation diffusion facilitator family transporter [Candidatus Krumholzibacteriaceae bacterium]